MDEEDAQARFEDRLRDVAQNLPPASRADLRRLARGLQSEMHAWRLFLLKFEHRSAQEQVSGILRELFGEISVVQAMQFADWIDLELALRETAALDRPIEIPDLDQWLEEYPNPEQAERRLETWNIQRESCAQHIHVPLLCWLRPRRLSALARRAADLWSWRHGVYDFCAENGDTDERLTQAEVMQPFSLNFDSRDAHTKRERIVEIKQYLEREGEDAGERLRADLYAELANLYDDLGEWDEALRINLEAVLPAYMQLNAQAGQAAALNSIGEIYRAQGDDTTALQYLQQSLLISHQIGDNAAENSTLNNISSIYQAQGDYGTALNYLKQSLAIRQQIGDKAGEGITLNNLANLCRAQGDHAAALHYLQQALTSLQEPGNKPVEAATRNNIAQIYKAQGDYATALDYLRQSVAISEQIGDKAGLCFALINQGHTFAGIGQVQEAFHAWAAAYQLAKDMHLHNALQALANVASQLDLPADFTGWEKLAANVSQTEIGTGNAQPLLKD